MLHQGWLDAPENRRGERSPTWLMIRHLITSRDIPKTCMASHVSATLTRNSTLKLIAFQGAVFVTMLILRHEFATPPEYACTGAQLTKSHQNLQQQVPSPHEIKIELWKICPCVDERFKRGCERCRLHGLYEAPHFA